MTWDVSLALVCEGPTETEALTHTSSLTLEGNFTDTHIN